MKFKNGFTSDSPCLIIYTFPDAVVKKKCPSVPLSWFLFSVMSYNQRQYCIYMFAK